MAENKTDGHLVCETCGLSFKAKQHLVNHQLELGHHCLGRLFECAKCHVKFNNTNDLTNHVDKCVSRDQTLPKLRYTCSKCPFEDETEEAALEHFDKMHLIHLDQQHDAAHSGKY